MLLFVVLFLFIQRYAVTNGNITCSFFVLEIDDLLQLM